MEKRKIVNIINFIRACEPRILNRNLKEPVEEQIRLMEKHHLKGTFLIQYDALILPEYTELLKKLDPDQFEIGVWFEVVQPQVEKAGLKWTGRYPWDWHTHCGFSVGYTKEEREKLVDVLYEEFKQVFGYYPRVFGSWLFDTHTIRYINERYGLDAICNCRDQYGTDGYTLWGGYYGQAYYPSRNNVFMPAQSRETQLGVPLFRMLGSDPVYQYDRGIDENCEVQGIQGVITLEAACGCGGKKPEWVDWYMKENFNGECLSFGYAQAGQENSFGWKGMRDGLTYQFALFEQLQKEGKIVVEPLGETGRWYKEAYAATPASAITAHTAFDDEDKNTVWYSSQYYRVNLYVEHGIFRIRDLHIFSENMEDPFENQVCVENAAAYETLPFIDGYRHSGNGVLAGGYLVYEEGEEPVFGKMKFTETGEGTAAVTYGDVVVELTEEKIKITGTRPFALVNRIGTKSDHLPSVKSCEQKKLVLSYHNVDYAVRVLRGEFTEPVRLKSDGNVLELQLN